MRKIQSCVLLAVAAVMLMVGCSPPPGGPSSSPATQVPLPTVKTATPIPSARSAWEVEWDRVQAAGASENLLTFATSATGRELATAFQNRFGIRAESISATAGLLASKILNEQRAGLYLWDAFIGGAGTQVTSFKSAGATVPLDSALILPDLTDPAAIKIAWYGGRLPWVDKDHHLIAAVAYDSVMAAINTNLAKPGEIKVWDDLLNPKWKGKIMMLDPTKTGKTGSSGMPFLYEVKGEAWVRNFAKQDIVITPDARITLDWLAHGKYPVVVGPREADFVEFSKIGAPIAPVDFDDIRCLESGSSPLSMVRNSPHPNAAKMFINWFLSKEGQTVYSKALGSPSVRLDVSTEGIPAYAIVKQDRKYFNKDQEELLVKIPDYTNKSREIFGIK